LSYAVIPIKNLIHAKSRLATHLSTEQRRALVLSMLGNTIEVLRATRSISKLALITPEPALGIRFAIETLPDTGTLNAALLVAVKWALEAAAPALLIVPADLPLITSEAVAALLLAGERAEVVVAATHDGGTGALLLRPPDAVLPSFGPGSGLRHMQHAAIQGRTVEALRNEAFLYDLDTGEDLERLRAPLSL
jgi:2-phospho-L-lactate/phosphoenolpyruvate guanylyltransferase